MNNNDDFDNKNGDGNNETKESVNKLIGNLKKNKPEEALVMGRKKQKKV